MKKRGIKEKSKKGILRIVFSRTGVIFAILIIQFLILFALFKLFGKFYISYASTWVLGLIMLIYLINNRQNPSVKIPWIIIVAILPIFGTLMYWYIRLDFEHRITKKRSLDIYMATKDILKEDVKDIPYDVKSISKLAGKIAYNNTEVKYFNLGDNMFNSMLEELEKAEKFIFLEYFIISKGYMWDRILDILKRKASEGVEVRVMYDGTCAISNLPYSYPHELKSMGINAKMYAPIKPFLTTYYNNRDHRKIMVIDNKVGYTGGANLADEYINLNKRFGYWKDTAVKLKGDAVKELTLMFLNQWSLTEKGTEDVSKYLKTGMLESNEGYVIPYSENPFTDDLVAENIYMYLINNAKDYVYITTPYFVTDNELLTSILNAAKRGVDVRMVLPGIPDKELPFAIARSYYEELIKVGVRVYEYTPGFIHAKMLISDDIKAVVGTINFDYRSLYHNFECAVFMYKQDVIKHILDDLKNIFNISKEKTLEDVKNDNILRKLLGRSLKFFAPLI